MNAICSQAAAKKVTLRKAAILRRQQVPDERVEGQEGSADDERAPKEARPVTETHSALVLGENFDMLEFAFVRHWKQLCAHFPLADARSAHVRSIIEVCGV